MPTTSSLTVGSIIVSFANLFNQTNDTTCETTIQIEEKTYDTGTKWYYVNYSYVLSDGTIIDTIEKVRNTKCHPFNSNIPKDQVIHHFDGYIVSKNSMTSEMVRYLLMSDDDLASYSGRNTPQQYRISLMRGMSYLWD
jgi:hypothetical protein